jgi:hypothetical protein
MTGDAQMSAKIEAFLTEIRNMPGFVAASAIDPKWIAELDAIERMLNAIDRKADDDPQTIEIFDKLLIVIDRNDLSLKQRLLEVGKLLVQFRDAQGVRH